MSKGFAVALDVVTMVHFEGKLGEKIPIQNFSRLSSLEENMGVF